MGRSADEVAHEAIACFLDNEARFAATLGRGIEAADRGEFVEAEQVWEGVERILQS
jgi:predicted transcriptional regulator